ncbi:GNAT family N-acetyltransferase [Pandoraea sputorum]|uniref:GNAT family N-acetyltransferase n=1 Tax=Pandoraea sputorum TaxID=93222 RepID=UPI00177C9105|nr:GNAT family N-acetyltransferase [Pandoraea sputorum]
MRIGPAQKIVGRVELVKARAHVHVANLAVAPAFQRRGLGSLLLQFAKSQAQRLRRPEVRLFMKCEMHTNQRFYARRGYVLARTERLPGLEIAVMAKPVLGAPAV